jgi:CubicO group peptidase (beta-lactamase class C family)
MCVRPGPRFRLLLPAFSVAALALAACSGSTTVDPGAASLPAVTSTAPTTTTTTTTTLAPTTTTAPPTTVAAPTADVFPGTEWATGELPAGVESAAIDAAVETAFGAPDAAARVRSLVVVQGGRIVHERYHPLDGPDTIMASYSVAKSFASALIGMLVGDGLLTVDQPAPVAAWSDPADPRHAITIEHLLHMASGLEWTEEYGPDSQALTMLRSPVASEYAASFPLEAQPGEKFEYSTGTTAILAGIITDTLGGVEQTDDYIQTRLFDPLGITSTTLLRDGSGRWLGGLGADSTARDFARFGLLFLNDGVWDGQRILPEGWVDYSSTPSATNPQYGAQWWMLHPDSFEARGLFGQIVLVSQPHDLVLVITTTQGGDADTLVNAVYDQFT